MKKFSIALLWFVVILNSIQIFMGITLNAALEAEEEE